MGTTCRERPDLLRSLERLGAPPRARRGVPDQVESQATTGISGLVDILGRISARTRVLALRRAGDGQDDDRDAVPAGRRDGRRATLYITLSETEEECGTVLPPRTGGIYRT